MASFYRRYERIYQSKIQELLADDIENGTIDAERITAYIVQDIHYMESLVSRLEELAQSGVLAEPSRSILRRDARITETMVEEWKVFLLENGRGNVYEEVNDRTADYIEHQRLAVEQGPHAGLAAILPCYLYCYGFVATVRKAIANANIVDTDLKNYLGRFAERLPHYKMPSWDDDILKIWDEATLSDDGSFNWSDIKKIFLESSTHEWRMLECANNANANAGPGG